MMTREEALKLLEYPVYKWSMDWDEREDGLDYTEAIDIALTALRPVSREQVEWMRGEWISTGAISCQCSKCKYLEFKSRAKEYSYCPCCGAPMTDEAVEMVMERLEALKDGSTTD